MQDGYIYLDRCIRGHWVYKKPEYFAAWVKMLFEVRFSEEAERVFIDGAIIDCGRGQSLNSISTWCNVLGKGWTTQKVRTFFKLLETDKMISTENMKKTTRLTVCNYDTYQNKKQAANAQSTSGQLELNESLTTEEGKEVTKGKKGNVKRFVKPTVAEVKEYSDPYGKGKNKELIDPQGFVDHYISKGWVVGKSPMKDWKATVRNWYTRQPMAGTGQSSKQMSTEGLV